jgi:hypothetical protein
MRLPWQRQTGGGGTTTASPPLPPPGSAVELVLADGRRLHGRLGRRQPEGIEVLLLLRAALTDSQLRGATLEIKAPNGVVRLGGTAAIQGDDTVLFSTLRLDQTIQRREHVRVRCARPVLVRSAGGGVPIECTTVDLSGGGMLVAGASHLQSGERIEFRIVTSPDAPPITGSGVVVRIDRDGRRAICFDGISEGNQRRLIRFLFECQRQELRRGLEGRDGR